MNEIAARNIRGEWIHHRADGTMLGALMTLFGSGQVPLPEIQVLALEDAAKAHQLSEVGRTRGKLVLAVQTLDV